MELLLDFGKTVGKIKPMHAVNNGPTRPVRMFSKGGNFEHYRDACIPFARNHDAAFCASYGGEHTVDIHAIFPDFDADETDPASYDFACTDHYTQTILDAGTEVFYRLGNKIDHRVKKYDSVPPKDFHKWARICEHVIAHYNEGWANGFHHGIRYWEIWNEPENGRECWDGPYEDFLVLFALTAKHLKNRFPNIKIGGPAFATGGVDHRRDEFLRYMKEREVPLDFFSWHLYRVDTEEYKKRILGVRESLDAAGYLETESILNEWAYVINWHEGLRESKIAIHGMKGASHACAVMATGQKYPLDMLMYYDARPDSTLNCLFDFYTNDRLKGYYSFKMFSRLYALGNEIAVTGAEGELYAVAAAKESARRVMLTYYTNRTDAVQERVSLVFADGESGTYTVRLLDGEHDDEEVGTLSVENGRGELVMAPNTVVTLERA